MKNHQTLQADVLRLGLLTLSAVKAERISKTDYKAGKKHISETYKADTTACHSQSGNAKDVCEEEAKEKCDDLASEAKASCVAAVKGKLGKN